MKKLIPLLLALLGFTCACEPEEDEIMLMYGVRDTTYEEKQTVTESEKTSNFDEELLFEE